MNSKSPSGGRTKEPANPSGSSNRPLQERSTARPFYDILKGLEVGGSGEHMLFALVVAAQAIRGAASLGKAAYESGQDARARSDVDWQLAISEARMVLANPERYPTEAVEEATLVIGQVEAQDAELERKAADARAKEQAKRAAEEERARAEAARKELQREAAELQALAERDKRREWADSILAAPDQHDPLDVLTATEYLRQLGLM